MSCVRPRLPGAHGSKQALKISYPWDAQGVGGKAVDGQNLIRSRANLGALQNPVAIIRQRLGRRTLRIEVRRHWEPSQNN